MLNNIFLKNKNIKVYTPCQFETGIKGYWLDDQGKLYKDNIIIQSVNALQFQGIKDKLYKAGEKAIFYIENERAYIEDKKGLITLKNKKIVNRAFINDFIIKEYCKIYNGITVFKNKECYTIEIWQK